MARKPGLIGESYRMITTTVVRSANIVDSTTGALDTGFQALPAIAEEFNNDQKESLIDSRVRLVEKKLEAITRLKSLGVSDEEVAILIGSI